MGTKLGNLQIKGASVEEVSALLPGALVGQWAEGFVSAYHENFQWGTVEREGKKLSRKLPAATVLAAALFDDDVVSFELFQAGKRLTVHLLNPYEDQNVSGKPRVFCEALSLPAEDEKRLKVLWKKGDACEQLELTGALLELPLWADAECPPEEKTVRDAAKVDAWIAEHPDPPRIKNITRAELLQEEGGLGWGHSRGSKDWGGSGRIYFTKVAEDGGWYLTDGWIYRYTPAGPLEREERAYWYCEEDYPLVGENVCYGIAPDRVLGGRELYQEMWGSCYTGWGIRLLWDSAGHLGLPLDIEGGIRRIWSLPGGGIGIITEEYPEAGEGEYWLRQYAPEGQAVREKKLPGSLADIWLEDGFFVRSEEKELILLDWNGEELLCWKKDPGLYCCATEGDLLFLKREGDKSFLLRLDWTGKELARSPELPRSFLGDYHACESNDGEHLFLSIYKEGLYLLDRKSLAVVWSQPRKDYVNWELRDGAGRYWVLSGDSTLEAYDRDWNLVSRHRLKGLIFDTRLDQEGRLLAYTHQYNKSILRVYCVS